MKTTLFLALATNIAALYFFVRHWLSWEPTNGFYIKVSATFATISIAFLFICIGIIRPYQGNEARIVRQQGCTIVVERLGESHQVDICA